MATAGRHAPPPDPATLTALQIPASAVRDSIAAVFRQPAYDRTVRQTVWDHIVSWIGDLFRALFDAVHGSRPVYWTVVTALVVVALAAIARAIYLGQLRMPGCSSIAAASSVSSPRSARARKLASSPS